MDDDEAGRKEFARMFFSLWIPHPPVKHRQARKKHKRMPVLAVSRRIAQMKLPLIRRPEWTAPEGGSECPNTR